jgi:type III restriction enzyme
MGAGHWEFAEFTEVYQIEADFTGKVEGMFNKIIDETIGAAQPTERNA